MKLTHEFKNNIEQLIDQAHEKQNGNSRRSHLGCSSLGHTCDRWLWLSFRMAITERFSGRMLRLFRRGHNEEKTVVDDLRLAGMKIVNTGASQSRVSFGNHVSGSIDGIITSGVPEAENTEHVLEIKTHSLKSFKEVEKDGVKNSKPQHYVQMQTYMLGKKLKNALYVAICKDDDRIYTERVEIDEKLAEKYIKRGHQIVSADRMPPPLSTDPTWFECKFCAAHEFCHKTQLTKNVNCRTCAHSTAERDGTWSCAHWESTIPNFDAQLAGCSSHILHPDLTPWKYSPTEHGVVWHTPDGDIKNGESSFDTFESTEIVANPKACASGDRFVEDMREMFGGKVVG